MIKQGNFMCEGGGFMIKRCPEEKYLSPEKY
jgi:hypothetical protein